MIGRFTNRSMGWRGDNVVVTVRVPRPVVEFIDSHLDDYIRNRSEFLQMWAAFGAMYEEAHDG